MIELGKPLPIFTLYNQNNKIITDNNFLGCHSILYFYPKDNTPGCTKEACDFNDSLNALNKLKTPVYGISPDSVASHKKFHTKYNLGFNLIADQDLFLAKKMGVYGKKKLYGKEYMGIVRTTFIIDPFKKVAFIFGNVKVKGHVEKIIEKLKEINLNFKQSGNDAN